MSQHLIQPQPEPAVVDPVADASTLFDLHAVIARAVATLAENGKTHAALLGTFASGAARLHVTSAPDLATLKQLQHDAAQEAVAAVASKLAHLEAGFAELRAHHDEWQRHRTSTDQAMSGLRTDWDTRWQQHEDRAHSKLELLIAERFKPYEEKLKQSEPTPPTRGKSA